MIRLFVLIGVIGTVAVSSLILFGTSPEFQMAPKISLLPGYQNGTLIPAPNSLVENEEVEHGVFEVPAEDERELEEAELMAGMNMSGDAAMGGDDTSMSGMNMSADGTAMDGGDDSMPGKEMGGKGGLRITEDGAFDRQIELAMEEWRFSDMNIELKRGERIRFTITNTGKIPHEFMFMEMAAMAAVNYRAERADWNLLEHEALYEKSLVLPDGSFSFVVQVQRDGVWMFMCMLPYHMQMGMMGQMATPGFAMEM